VVYQSETKGDTDYGTAGTLEGWQSNISAMAIDNPMLALAICTASLGHCCTNAMQKAGGHTLLALVLLAKAVQWQPL
jgi:hypothetical protein